MCLQCCAQSTYYGEILPKWHLTKATVTVENEWEAGEWGLVRCNDPDFVFKVEPIKDPTSEFPPDEEEWNDSQCDIDYQYFRKAVEFGYNFTCISSDMLEAAHSLMDAAETEGYDKQQHGQFYRWFLNRMAVFLETANPIMHSM